MLGIGAIIFLLYIVWYLYIVVGEWDFIKKAGSHDSTDLPDPLSPQQGQQL